MPKIPYSLKRDPVVDAKLRKMAPATRKLLNQRSNCACIACEGSGVASRGGRDCPICEGTGRKRER